MVAVAALGALTQQVAAGLQEPPTGHACGVGVMQGLHAAY
jgi:hypothetical protein